MLIYASPPIPSGREGGNLCLLVWSRFGHQPPVSVSQDQGMISERSCGFEVLQIRPSQPLAFV